MQGTVADRDGQLLSVLHVRMQFLIQAMLETPMPGNTSQKGMLTHFVTVLV